MAEQDNHKVIEWRTEQRKLRDLVEWEKNPRQLSHHDAEHIRRSIEKFGLADPLVINIDGQIIGGHQRKRIMLALEAYGPDAIVDVRIPSRALVKREIEELNIRLNRNTGEFDFDILANEFNMTDLLNWGFTDFDFSMHEDLNSVEFKEYDESIADEVEWNECPECGHRWPK